MRTQRRSKQQRVAGAMAAFVFLGALAMLALTTSTTLVPTKQTAVVALPPENEALEHGNAAAPNEFKDFQLSSNAAVTRAQVDQMKAQAAAVEPAAAPNGLSWKQLGPYNIGGRVTDVVADRFTPDAAFAAVSGGGIWKTTDGGEHWTSTWPDANTQAMGAFAQAPDGTLWAGTGE